MLLGSRIFATSDIRRLVVNYEGWLNHGFTLVSVTATISPTSGIKSTVGAITLDPRKEKAFVFLNCGTVNESFTLNVVATDNFGQTVNDQLLVAIASPGAT
jgi:hypothetical protein